MAEKGKVTFQVAGEEPVKAVPALFSNFLAVSRVGTEVQFEFIFLDLNQIARILEAAKAGDTEVPRDLAGKTIAKIVMPAASFVQLKEHLDRLFTEIDAILEKPTEVQDAAKRASSG